jgi:hypothetical protein
MTICPIAIAVGCARCPAVKVCPLKGVLGDAKPPEAAGALAADKPAGKPVSKASGKPAAKASASKKKR